MQTHPSRESEREDFSCAYLASGTGVLLQFAPPFCQDGKDQKPKEKDLKAMLGVVMDGSGAMFPETAGRHLR